MNNNLLLFCDTCGEMKKISYKYENDDLLINCECIKEKKKRNYLVDLFLNNKFTTVPKLNCTLHNSSFTDWCEDCKFNLCDSCLGNHEHHKITKLSSLLIDQNDINILDNIIQKFGEKLEQKKKIVEEKKIFNQKEENEFFVNFNKYYNLNINEIAFVRFIKDQYQYLLNKNMICYQIIINLQYLIEKLKLIPVNSEVINSLNNNMKQNNEEMNDFVDIYNMVFKFQHYCLLPNNDNEENDKIAEEKQTDLFLERSYAFSMKNLSEIQNEENFNEYMKNIPMTQSVNLINEKKNNFDLFNNSINSNFNINNYINNNNNNSNNNNSNNNSNNNNYQENEKIDLKGSQSQSLITSINDSNYFLLKSKTVKVPEIKEQYFGPYKEGKYHGDNARLIYPNGFIYEGSFRDGLRHGKGTLSNPDETYLYDGEWAFDKKNGKCLEIINGEQFDGFYKNDIRDGDCTITYSNKDTFKGNLINGLKNGYGEQYCFSSKSTYKGEFRNNVFEGTGEIINETGYHYQGGFLGGLRHGDNCLEEKIGVRKYKGQFKRDKMNGKGIYEWYEGQSKGDIYNGDFKDDLFDGNGTYQFSDGTIYIGEFKRGVKEGKGKIIYSDGSFYEGEYMDGHKSGKGVFQDMEGNKYEGNFYNGNKHSKGKETYTNGETLEGFWLNGLKEGNFIFVDSDGTRYNRKYIRDELIEQEKQGFLTSVFGSLFDKIKTFIK